MPAQERKTFLQVFFGAGYLYPSTPDNFMKRDSAFYGNVKGLWLSDLETVDITDSRALDTASFLCEL